MKMGLQGRTVQINAVFIAAAVLFAGFASTAASGFSVSKSSVPGASIQTCAAPAKICVFEPAGGAEYRSGDIITVKWAYEGISDYAIAVLQLVNNGRASFQGLCIPIGYNGIGSYTWTVPTNIAGDSFKFRVRTLLSSGESEAFSINTISFSGMNWHVKDYGSQKVAPDSNYFTASRSNVWVDECGNLHLRLTYANNRWNCVELWTANAVGYGKYVFDVATDLCAESLDKNVVFGIFTWNSESTLTDANSELDIEITKWRVETDDIVHYTVQPGNTLTGIPYEERTSAFHMPCINESQYVMEWHQDIVKFSSTFGSEKTAWSFDDSNPARAREGSLPVAIPSPGSSTQLHINLWLSQGNAPSDGEEFEVVVSGFYYEAAQ